MPELETVQPVKKAGFVDSKYNRNAARKAKIEQEERELEELIKQSRGEEDGGDDGSDTPDGEARPAEKEAEGKQQEKKNEHSVEEEKEEKELSPEEKSFKKRYGDLRRHMQRKEKEWEEKFNKLKAQETLKAPATEEDIKKWQEKYPQVANVIETIALKKAQEMFDKADERLKEFDQFAYEAEREKAVAVIRKSHPDFDELRESDDFHEWADDQPKWVQDALYENEDDARSVIRVIDLYKQDKGLTKTDKKRQEKEAASAVGTKQTRTKVDADEAGKKIKESQVAKWSDKEFAEREEEVNEAMRSGNFIYDISGGAR